MKPDPTPHEPRSFDVVILGGGLAGLTLARHLALHTDRSVALIERRDSAQPRPKVGESTVQLAGYYFGRVLDLERYLFDEHYLKYNLRFYWPAEGTPGDDFDQFSQVYLRTFSNICSFQIDRNRFEDAVRERLVAADAVEFFQPAERLQVELGEGEAHHRVSFSRLGQAVELQANWVVDATGRNKFLQKHLHRGLSGSLPTETPLAKASPIRHGASFLWVDGGIDGGLDLERMTRRSRDEVRLSSRRQQQGHTPQWLATNHFCGEGWWLWVIPLRGLTSIGLVFDSEVIDFSTVSSAPLLLDWIRETLPLFCQELESRNVVGHSGIRSFAHDCRLTLSPDRWAMTGEAGRFSDPLYSPGSDLISLHNTMIVDAITAADDEGLIKRCHRSETLLQALYAGYVPSYAESYDALGDPEAFAMKYSWELAVYFGFYVFPFINDLFTDERFVVIFLRRFAQLGAVNGGLHRLLSQYFQWKKATDRIGGPVVDFELSQFAPLARAEKTFYRVGVSVDDARRELDLQLESLDELALFIVARIASVFLDRPEAKDDAGFVAALDPATCSLDAEVLERLWEENHNGEPQVWTFDSGLLDRFDRSSKPIAMPATH